MKIGTIGILLAVSWSGLVVALPSGLEWRPLTIDGEAARPGDPIALVSGDFDADGVRDLLCEFAAPDGHFLMLYRGNVDAIFPHTPAARQRRSDDTFTDAPFLGPGRVVEASAPLPEQRAPAHVACRVPSATGRPESHRAWLPGDLGSTRPVASPLVVTVHSLCQYYNMNCYIVNGRSLPPEALVPEPRLEL